MGWASFRSLCGHQWQWAAQLTRFFRVCAYCARQTRSTKMFCEECHHELLGFALEPDHLQAQGYPFPVYTLFAWRGESTPRVRHLIYSLKGGGLVDFWQEMAWGLSWRRAHLGDLCPGVFVVPPRHKSRRRDHAWQWAQALSKIWSWQVMDQLEFTDPSAQKKLSLEDRLRRSFYWQGELPTNRSWIYVDDLITSGATANAAFQALGRPEHFEVWALARRPLLAS